MPKYGGNRGGHLSSGTIRNRQLFQIIVERQLFLFQEGDMFLQWHGEILAYALGRRLIMEPVHYFFAALERRRAGRREEYSRNDAANDGAVKTFVVGQIFQNRKAAHAAASELDRTFAQTFFHLVKIDIVPRARIADDDERFRFHRAPS